MWVSEFLVLDASRITLYRREKRQWLRLAEFAPDATGLAEFIAWRRKEARPLMLVSDLPEEGFAIESIPKLSGGERKALLQRKIKRHFPDTPYVATRTLSRQVKQGRKEETLLFSSLPLLPLADWLAAARPVAGLYALTQLIEAAGKKLGLPEDCIVLTRCGNMVRQTLIRGGVPSFSRFANGENLREETRRLITYLERQLPLEGDLPLCPLCELAEEEQEALAAEFTLIPGFAADDVFFLSLLAEHPPKTQYAPQELLPRSSGRERVLLAAGVLTLVAGLAFAAHGYREAERLQEERGLSLQALAREMSPREEAGLALERANRLLAHLPEIAPETLFADLQNLSRLLDAVPALRLEMLAWEEGKMVAGIEIDAATEPALAAFLRAARMRGYESSEVNNVNGVGTVVLARRKR